MPTCFFIGHREAPEHLIPKLSAEIERHITECNVTDFIVGGYGRFDMLAAGCVTNAKKRHPEVTLTRLLAYYSQEPVPIPSGFDRTLYPEGMEKVPKRAAIIRANHYMIDHSDYLIAYAWHPASNARNLVEYAEKREQQGLIKITLLTDPPSASGSNPP